MGKKLYLSTTDKKIAGVCGGIAECFHFESSLVRIICVLLVLLLKMTPVIVYVILWAVLPKQEE
ncbi:MAG: PspC domain-containing protein [Epulopiscium sp.]|jgi:phage shock protein C|nr:PspC domain-containing protein [Candidatus Epulonipiscium sp.]